MQAKAEEKLYFCLVCQKPTGMEVIRKGLHAGHVMTEFQCTKGESDSDWKLMRRFRQKVEAMRRYKDLLFRRDF